MFLGIFGRLILKIVPPAALLVPIAGIGIAFLGLEQLSNSIAAPIVGYYAITWVFLGWYAGVKLGWGKYRVPEAVMVMLVGTILGWATGLNQPNTVKEAALLVKWWGPVWSATDLFSDFSLVADYLGIIIPIGISAVSRTSPFHSRICLDYFKPTHPFHLSLLCRLPRLSCAWLVQRKLVILSLL